MAAAAPGNSQMNGSDPLFLALVRARGGVGFHKHHPAPSGVAPVKKSSLREGRQSVRSGWGKRGASPATGILLGIPQEAGIHCIVGQTGHNWCCYS